MEKKTKSLFMIDSFYGRMTNILYLTYRTSHGLICYPPTRPLLLVVFPLLFIFSHKVPLSTPLFSLTNCVSQKKTMVPVVRSKLGVTITQHECRENPV